MRAEGLVTVSGIIDSTGKKVSFEKAVKYGWINGDPNAANGWDIPNDEYVLGKNLYLDNARQASAYAFGFRSPIDDFVCRKVGFGTGTIAPKITDVSLEAPILLSNGEYTKTISGVDFPAPFVARIEFTLGAGDANGFLITEMGLFTQSDTLLCRRTNSVGINKSSDFAPTMTWRLRF
jgi:hypothetical protein